MLQQTPGALCMLQNNLSLVNIGAFCVLQYTQLEHSICSNKHKEHNGAYGGSNTYWRLHNTHGALCMLQQTRSIKYAPTATHSIMEHTGGSKTRSIGYAPTDTWSIWWLQYILEHLETPKHTRSIMEHCVCSYKHMEHNAPKHDRSIMEAPIYILGAFGA